MPRCAPLKTPPDEPPEPNALAVIPSPEPVLATDRAWLLLFALMALVLVNVFAAANCGTLVVSRFTFTLPLLPPPVRSIPAVTPVIVPTGMATQDHAPLANSRI